MKKLEKLEQFFTDLKKNYLNNDIFNIYNSVLYISEKTAIYEDLKKIGCFTFWNQIYLLKSHFENKTFSKLERDDIIFLKDNIIKLVLIFDTEKNNYCFLKN